MYHPLNFYAFASAIRPAPRSLSVAHGQVVELIRRYPDLSERELKRLIRLFRRLSTLDLSLMMADAKLGPRLDAFCADRRVEIAVPFADLAVIGVILALPILILLTFFVF